MDISEPVEVIESIEDFAKSSVKKPASPKKGTTVKKRTTVKKGAARAAGPVAPPVVKAEVGKVVAYHADKNQPVPAPRQIVITATFNPVFITDQPKRMPTTTSTPTHTTSTPTTFTPETTTTTPIQTMTTSSPSDFLQYVTYSPAEMPSAT